MRPKMFAMIMGLAMVIVGVLAFIPNLNVVPDTGMPALAIDSSYGLFLGYVPMNSLNKILLITMGAVGFALSMAPATALPASIRWSRILAVLTAVLAIAGLFPQTYTLFGYMPVYGWNVAAAAIIAVAAAYEGWALSSRVPEQKMAPSHSHVAGVR